MANTMKSLSVSIPDQLDRRIGREAVRRGISKYAFAREALSTHFSNSRNRVPSVLDLVRNIVGKYDGLGDVSTNPKYMEDFGK